MNQNKENKHYTSIEQSKKLLELGLSPDTADMNYMFFKDDGHIIGYTPFVIDGYEVKGEDSIFDYLPCWSVGALSEILSNSCNRLESSFRYNKKWNVFVQCEDTAFRSFDVNSEGYDTLFDITYAVVVWLLDNNYIKKGLKD